MMDLRKIVSTKWCLLVTEMRIGSGRQKVQTLGVIHRAGLEVQKRKLNPFPNKLWFLHVCRTSLLKTQWEKEKLLGTSNFSFFHSVFYPFRKTSTIFINFKIVVCKLFKLGRVQNLLFGKGLKTLY